MHQKLRNSLFSLGAAFAMVVGGLFFGEPVPAASRAADVAPAQALSPEARIVLAVLGVTVSIAQASAEIDAAEAEAAADTTDTAGSDEPQAASRPSGRARHQRPGLSMPYFSFASFLPRAPQES